MRGWNYGCLGGKLKKAAVVRVWASIKKTLNTVRLISNVSKQDEDKSDILKQLKSFFFYICSMVRKKKSDGKEKEDEYGWTYSMFLVTCQMKIIACFIL